MTRNRGETARVRRYFDTIADRYDRFIGYPETLLFGGGRQWVCEQACGEVLEIAVGTGRNFPYYAKDVRLTGVDISPAMLAVAERRANDLGRDIELRVGDAQALDLSGGRFDTVVSTLALCSIPDDRRAVAEVRHVLRPGGRFLLLEHVRSPILPVQVVQRLLDPLVVRFGADHLLREPLDHLAAEGFVVDRLERSKWGIVERVSAHKPAPPEA
jgi:ubiquinone/menaquinone biosynthesis C-methylase UbiE